MTITINNTGTGTEDHVYTEDWALIQSTHGLIVQAQNKFDERSKAPYSMLVTCKDKNGVTIGPAGTRPH